MVRLKADYQIGVFCFEINFNSTMVRLKDDPLNIEVGGVV